MTISTRLLVFFSIGLCGLFVACDASKPTPRSNSNVANSAPGTSRQVSSHVPQPAAKSSRTRYLEFRKKFKTKLLKKGPSPQEWENDKLPAHVQEISYPSGTLNLKGWVYVPPQSQTKPSPALVFCHGGFASSAEEIESVKPFVDAGYVVMVPAWRGENGNPGDFEMMFGEVDDAVNAVKWLATQPYVNKNRIYMFGHSIGGGISAVASLMDDVPLRHCGSSGGMYPGAIFEAWSDTTPFDFKNQNEVAMRILCDSHESMLRDHYAFTGKEDDILLMVPDAYKKTGIKAPMLHFETIPGDHFTSFDESVKRYLAIAEKDR